MRSDIERLEEISLEIDKMIYEKQCELATCMDENGKNIRGTGKTVLNWFEWEMDSKKEYPKIHMALKLIKSSTQKLEKKC